MFVYCMLCLFVLLCGFGVRNVVKVYRELQDSRAVLGTVVRLVESSGSDGGGSDHSVIAYEVNGTAYEYMTPWSSSPPTYGIGERVRIAHARLDASRGRVATAGSAYGTGFLMVFIGSGGLLFCLGLIHSDRVMRWLHPHLY